MDRFATVVITSMILLVVAVVSVGYWWNLNITTNIIHTQTIQVSHTDCFKDPIFGFVYTDVEAFGGDVYRFWGNQTKTILAGNRYEIAYRKEYRGFLYAWSANLLISASEI